MSDYQERRSTEATPELSSHADECPHVRALRAVEDIPPRPDYVRDPEAWGAWYDEHVRCQRVLEGGMVRTRCALGREPGHAYCAMHAEQLDREHREAWDAGAAEREHASEAERIETTSGVELAKELLGPPQPFPPLEEPRDLEGALGRALTPDELRQYAGTPRLCQGCRSLDGEHDFGPTCTLVEACDACGTDDHPEHGCAGNAYGKPECEERYRKKGESSADLLRDDACEDRGGDVDGRGAESGAGVAPGFAEGRGEDGSAAAPSLGDDQGGGRAPAEPARGGAQGLSFAVDGSRIETALHDPFARLDEPYTFTPSRDYDPGALQREAARQARAEVEQRRAKPRRKARSLDTIPDGPPKLGVKKLGADAYLAGTVHLSNKGCPRYYVTRDFADPDAADAPPKRCGCPKGACWYDAQLARRSKGQLALTHEAWLALEKGKATE